MSNGLLRVRRQRVRVAPLHETEQATISGIFEYRGVRLRWYRTRPDSFVVDRNDTETHEFETACFTSSHLVAYDGRRLPARLRLTTSTKLAVEAAWQRSFG